MANDDEPREESKPAGGRAKPAPPPPVPTAAEPAKEDGAPHERFTDAYRAYARALQEAWEEAQSRCREAHRTLYSEMLQSQLDAQRAWEEACRRYSRTVQETRSEGQESHGADAARDYLDQVRGAQDLARERWESAQQAWRDASRQAHEDFRKRCESAYRDYLRAVQAAWAGADPERLDPASLAHIVHSQIAAMHTAARTPLT